VLDWGDVSLGDADFDLAVIRVFFGEPFLARLLEHLPGRDAATVREKARFFTTLRAVQDACYEIDHGGWSVRDKGSPRFRQGAGRIMRSAIRKSR
jgi:aminoglycoside phosphotransferase (APT) family kinase protein